MFCSVADLGENSPRVLVVGLGSLGVSVLDGCASVAPELSFKATWSVRGICCCCKIMMLYGIIYTYYGVKPVKICFHVPFRG